MNKPKARKFGLGPGKRARLGRFEVAVLYVNGRAVKLGICLPSRAASDGLLSELCEAPAGHYVFADGQRIFVVSRFVGQVIRLGDCDLAIDGVQCGIVWLSVTPRNATKRGHAAAGARTQPSPAGPPALQCA